MPITMSNELFTLQRRAAEIALLLRQRIDEQREFAAEAGFNPVPDIGDWSVPSLLEELKEDAFAVCAKWDITAMAETAMYALDQLEMDGLIPNGFAAEAYAYAGRTLGWNLEGFND
jgi:hypothetical protein